MKISSDEITSVIKKQIENYKVDLNVDEVGTVLEVGDGIAMCTAFRIAWPANCSNFRTAYTAWHSTWKKAT